MERLEKVPDSGLGSSGYQTICLMKSQAMLD